MSGEGDKVGGKLKQAAGDLTGDKDLEREGERQEAAGKVKDGVDTAKDKVNDAVDKVKDAAND
ncbi:MAG: CsbD family protein [Ilumatobacter sp.]|nr:CsbD family protein [Ilumatobacter sp.]